MRAGQCIRLGDQSRELSVVSPCNASRIVSTGIRAMNLLQAGGIAMDSV